MVKKQYSWLFGVAGLMLKFDQTNKIKEDPIISEDNIFKIQSDPRLKRYNHKIKAIQ